MIHESQVKKVYGSDVKVVRKGDRGWTSDAEREREYAARTPGVEFYNGDKRPWAKRVVPDYREFTEYLDTVTDWEPGDRASIADGADVLTFEYREDGTWRYCHRTRNGAL